MPVGNTRGIVPTGNTGGIVPMGNIDAITSQKYPSIFMIFFLLLCV